MSVQKWPSVAAASSTLDGSQSHLIDWFRSRLRPLLLLNVSDLGLMACNDAGGELLRDGSDLRIQHDCLAFADPATGERFRSHLDLCPDEVSPWLLRQRDRERYLILEIDRLPTRSDRAAIMVAVHFSDGEGGHRWCDFGVVFGLTPAEERIARMLTGGENVEEIAAALLITIETARTHIRRIYNKVGVGSREQLSAILLPFRLG